MRTALLGLCLSACLLARAQGPVPGVDMQSEPAVLARTALGGLPGAASAAVWREGRVVEAGLRQAPGAPAAPLPADGPAPLFEIGSISKLYTGLLLAQAVERGELRLEDTLGQALKGQVDFSSADTAVITLGQLVTHTSCLPRQFGGVPAGPQVVQQIREAQRADLWAALARQSLAQRAPCAAQYSNYGMAVVGELLAQRAGMPWIALVQRDILRPLGVTDTVQHVLGADVPRLMAGFDGTRPGELWDMKGFAGAGALRASASDLVRFGRALLAGRGGPFGAAAERMLAPLAAYRGGQIGYAVFIDGPPERRTYSHDGATGVYRALLVMVPDSGEVLAVLAANAQAAIGPLFQALSMSRYPVTVSEVPLAADQLPVFAGMFRVFPDLALHVAVQDGRLYVRVTGGVFRAYVPVGPDRFARPAGGALLHFTRAPDGKVATATLEQYGRSSVGQRMDAVPLSTQPVLAPGKAAQYTGRYLARRLIGADIAFQVREVDGQLTIAGGAFSAQPVFPVPGEPDLFRYEVNQAEARFERDTKGAVVALRVSGRTEFRAERQPAGPPAAVAP